MKMGIIGYGNMGHWHSETIKKINNLEIKGIWDTNPIAREIARSEGVFVYNSQEEMLLDEDISLVLVATSNESHADIAILAMKAGKNVVCEKPVTISSKLLEDMISVSNETGKFFTVHQNRRWDPDFCTLKKVLQEGKLGDVFRIESRVHGSRGISNTWRRIKEKGGGIVFDWGPHLLDQILNLKAGVKVKSVYATFTNITLANVEDGFTAVLTFQDNTQAVIEAATSNFIQMPRWYVLGTNGTALIEDWKLSGKIICAESEEEDEVCPVITNSAYTKTMAPRRDDTIKEFELPKEEGDICEFYQNVIQVIEGKAKPIISNDEMRNVLKLIESIFESAYENKTVYNPLEN